MFRAFTTEFCRVQTDRDARREDEMRRVQLAVGEDGTRDYRRSVSEFREGLTRFLHRVVSRQAFVITRREASENGWSEEDVALVIPMRTTVREFQAIMDQLDADADEAVQLARREEGARGEDAPRVKSDVRIIGHVGDVKRGRRQQG
jgi:hypothetical protein